MTTDGYKVSTVREEGLRRWIGDGNWRVHGVVGTDTLVATCWDDEVFFKVVFGIIVSVNVTRSVDLKGKVTNLMFSKR